MRLFSTGEIVCCTNTDCTAVVTGGSTSYLSTTRATRTSTYRPEITSPPARTTEIIGTRYTTWYWTVTWWYLSFYWSTFRAESTVTYTRIYETTTYTITATDEYEASSIFSAMSKTLTFTPPANAQTSLASLLNAQPSETASLNMPVSTGLDLGESSRITEATSIVLRSTSSATTRATTSASVSLSSHASRELVTKRGSLPLFYLFVISLIGGILILQA